MPKYPTSLGSSQVLTTGQVTNVIAATDPMTLPFSSSCVAMPNNENTVRSYAFDFRFVETADGITPADPGAFEINLEHCTTDDGLSYNIMESINEGLNANYCGRLEMTEVVAKFMRATVVTITNGGVSCIANFTK